MKHVLTLIATAMTIAAALLPATASAFSRDEPYVTRLMAGGTNPASRQAVGDVSVWNDGESLHVVFTSTDPLRLTLTRLAVSASLGGIPQAAGNPVPGLFEVPGTVDALNPKTTEYTVPLLRWSMDTTLYIAANAIVGHRGPVSSWAAAVPTPPGRGGSAWGEGAGFPGGNAASYFTYTVEGSSRDMWPNGEPITLAYEDLPIDWTDWDYNDWVATMRVTACFWGTSAARELTDVEFRTVPKVHLADLTHAMHLGAGVFSADGTYGLYRDGILVDSGTYDHQASLDVVLVPDTSCAPLDVRLVLEFDQPASFRFPVSNPDDYHGEGLFFDPYLVVIDDEDPVDEVHAGDPRMLVVPVAWEWPEECQAVWLAYPRVGSAEPGATPSFVPGWWIR
jgi:hypothetical protein